MAQRGRTQWVWQEDDDDSDYISVPQPPPPPPKRSRSRLGVKITEERVESPGRRPRGYHHQYYQVPRSAHPHEQPDGIVIENHLNVPNFRPRASSQGAQPQPNFIPVYISQPREPSQERVKVYKPPKGKYVEDSSSDESHRRRHSKRRSSPRGEDYVLADMTKELARLKANEKKRQEADEEAAFYAKLEERKRRDEQKEHALILELQEKKRKEKEREAALLAEFQKKQAEEEEAEREAIARAELRRKEKEVKAKEEERRLLAAEKERAAKDKAERQQIIFEEQQRAAQEKKEREEERKRILAEEKAREQKEKEEKEALTKRVLAEEEERKAKEKTKKRQEDEAFKQKVVDKFTGVGYSRDYIEDILEQNQMTRRGSTRTRENTMALDFARPTYIRVQVRHLLPETLEYYQLPWDYDPDDDRYILIKEYISHEFQQELFEHTRRIKTVRKDRLITDGYTKEKVVMSTLKPSNVYKNDKDEMYLVRRKSTSKSPARRSWMFT